MLSKTTYLLMFLLFSAYSKHVKHRSPRFIGGTYTSTVTSTQFVTSLTPSSCVLLDPTLQPCRSVRYLSFPNFDHWNPYSSNSVKGKSNEPETTSLGWGEYFGFYAPTVTVTQIEMQTTVVKDPRIVVTYAVKGCRPHKIPDDLDRCEVPQTVSVQNVLPTSTITASQSSTYNNVQDRKENDTKYIQPNMNVIENNEVKNETNETHPLIESSTDNSDYENMNTKVPTEPLPI